MKKRLFIVSVFAVLCIQVTFAQKGKIENAQKEYDKLSYVKTTETLLQLAEEGNTSIELLQNLANAYYFNGKMEDAAKWYGQLLSSHDSIDSETYYKFSQSLKALQNYTEADRMMQKFSKLKPEDSRAKQFELTPNYLKEIQKLSKEFELLNEDFNTPNSDFGASFYDLGIVFASSREKGKIYTWNEQPYLDVYQVSEQAVSKVEGDVNTKYHESSTSFTNDGNTMYFTRNNFFNGKFKKNSEGEHSLKIYRATLVEGNWTNVESLAFNNDEYNVAHPALNADETKLYFASDMPGTLGSSDIFEVEIHEDGTFGEPRNLGAKINTEGRENFPFISNKGTLYFASDGHLGLGGLDIFEFENIESNGKSSQRVYNLGMPINSPKDDFGYIINETTRKGFVSSNRSGGKGDDDIYSFTKNICKQEVSGIVVDQDTNEVLSNASIIIYNSNQKELKQLMSDSNGAFNFELDCSNATYKVEGSKLDYEKDQEQFEVDAKLREVIALKLSLKAVPKAASIGTDLFELLNLKPIYFDYDKSDIRPDAEIELVKIINYLKEFPRVKVDVRSHTDSRGRDSYNLALSIRRNKATIDYLVAKGSIAKERISGKGYGETQLVNSCSNGVKCSKEQHQSNRRSEFIVVEN
ncbi:flagellar motor protein MotB [Flavobacteriales bacterium 34_180_T64]|nr:flagellar motor protein MotB [Flavobacteriales bacterium 34_180_T64]